MARLTVHCGKRAPRGRQTVMVSATLTAKVIGAAQAGSTPCQAAKLPASKPVGHCIGDSIKVLFLSFCHAIWRVSILCLHSSAAAGLACMVRCWLQMLQETQHWCPNPERIFVKSDGSAATADELDAAAARMQSNAEAGPRGEAAAPQGQHTRLDTLWACSAASICVPAVQVCFRDACQPACLALKFGACLRASCSLTSCKPSCCKPSMSTHADLAAEAPPDLPPHLEHLYIDTTRRHRVDAVRRCIHALDLRRVLVFMNYQQRLKVRCMPDRGNSQQQLEVGCTSPAVVCLTCISGSRAGSVRSSCRSRMLWTARALLQLLSCLPCLHGWGLSFARLWTCSTVCDLQGSCHPQSMARGDLHKCDTSLPVPSNS